MTKKELIKVFIAALKQNNNNYYQLAQMIEPGDFRIEEECYYADQWRMTSHNLEEIKKNLALIPSGIVVDLFTGLISDYERKCINEQTEKAIHRPEKSSDGTIQAKSNEAADDDLPF